MFDDCGVKSLQASQVETHSAALEVLFLIPVHHSIFLVWM